MTVFINPCQSYHGARNLKKSILKILHFIFLLNSRFAEYVCGKSRPWRQTALPTLIDTSVKASSILGVIIGQLFFGILSDRLGRTRMFTIVLIISIVGTFGSALSASTMSGLNIFAILVMWRFIVGIGIGGDFPLSGNSYNFMQI